MTALLWIPATLAAAMFQVGRNALQRSLSSAAGPWGATLVRFLFGLPFALVFAASDMVLVRPHLHADAGFWLSAVTGAASQVLATATMLMAMQRAGFAVGTALQQSSLPLAALLGVVVYGDRLSAVAWSGVAVTTVGLLALGRPRRSAGPHPLAGAAFGLLSGLLFGFSLNAFRHAALSLDAVHPASSAIVCVAVVQAMQAAVLIGILLVADPRAVRAVVRDWRTSLGAGLCGTCASVGWFVALALAPAAPVRALGIVEAPIAALAGHRLFRERLGARQLLAGAMVIGGVVLTSLC